VSIAEVTPLRVLEEQKRLLSWSNASRPSALRPLLPGGSVQGGSTVTVTGSTSLALAAAATARQDGGWCAVVNAPDLGLLAAAEAGFDLEKLALIPRPQDRWPAVAAALIDAFDVVLLSLGKTVPRFADARRLSARARERNSVLVAIVDQSKHWPQADLRLHCQAVAWQGLGKGSGHLSVPQMHVSVSGKGSASQVVRGQIAMVAS
jgi:hypothetical protein